MTDEDPIGEEELAAVSTREELADLLNKLLILADSPSLRDLHKWSLKEGKINLAKTTVAEMLAGKRFPSKAVLITFVELCEVPENRLGPWKKAWGRVALAERGRPPVSVELKRLRQEAIAQAEADAAQIRALAHEQRRKLVRQTDEEIAAARKRANADIAAMRREANQEITALREQAANEIAAKNAGRDRGYSNYRGYGPAPSYPGPFASSYGDPLAADPLSPVGQPTVGNSPDGYPAYRDPLTAPVGEASSPPPKTDYGSFGGPPSTTKDRDGNPLTALIGEASSPPPKIDYGSLGGPPSITKDRDPNSLPTVDELLQGIRSDREQRESGGYQPGFPSAYETPVGKTSAESE